jgi:hypothetical protein
MLRPRSSYLLAFIVIISCSGTREPRSLLRRGPALAPLAAGAAAADAEAALVCVVVRTYWGHGTYGDNSLSELLYSLGQQTHTRCA